jgi:hypothetical protein
MWNNALNIQWGVPTSTLTVTYSDIQYGWSGVGNIDADPSFMNAANGDFHLKADSPAIDTGTNIGAPTTDYEGDARPLDGDIDATTTTDMGADEFVPYQIFLPLAYKMP